MFFTIFKKDELTKGHEGVQMGIHLTKNNNSYLFSGIETIP